MVVKFTVVAFFFDLSQARNLPLGY